MYINIYYRLSITNNFNLHIDICTCTWLYKSNKILEHYKGIDMYFNICTKFGIFIQKCNRFNICNSAKPVFIPTYSTQCPFYLWIPNAKDKYDKYLTKNPKHLYLVLAYTLGLLNWKLVEASFFLPPKRLCQILLDM